MGTQQPHRLFASSLATSRPSHSSALEAATPSPLQERLDVLRHFDAVFSETPVSSPKDIEEAFRLRYQVYCLDRGFEDATACPDGQERDQYDDAALHCLLRDRIGRHPLGTARVVTTIGSASGIDSLPLAEYAPEESMEILRALPGASTAEVSRVAITRSARDILRQAAEARPGTTGETPQCFEKLLPYMTLGLFRSIIRVSVRQGLTHWCLAAEPSLLRRLRSLGLHFQPAGPLVEHRGLRQICYAEITALLARAEIERPEVWDIMTLGGLLLSNESVRIVA